MHNMHNEWFSPNGRAASIKGFLSPLSAQFISTLLDVQLSNNVHGSIAEIGTYMGRTFVGLAMAARPGEVVLGVDLFPPEVEAGFRSALSMLSEQHRQAVVAVRRNTMQMQTSDWVGLLKVPARFVHIDGGHNHAAIVNDMHLAASYLADNALVVLDDFMHDWYPDLTEGIVDSLRASHKIVPIAIIPRVGALTEGGTKLVCGSKSGAETYRLFLLNKFSDHRPQRRKFCGHDVVTFQGF